MHRILFSFGNYPIYAFGVFVALGCILASYLASSRAERFGIDRDATLEACVWVVALGVLGARLGFVVQNFSWFSQHPLEMLNLRAGGMSWHGAIVGIVVGAWLPTRRMGVRLLDFLDLIAPGILLGLGVGRIGCFLNGCCYGKITESGFAITTPIESDPLHAFPRYPTQLLEMTLAFLLVPVLLAWLDRRRFRGEVFFGFLIVYSMIRFCVEFFREGAAFGGTSLTLAQWVSVGLVAVGTAGIAWGRSRGGLRTQEGAAPVGSHGP